jgi:hypothetical protein
LASFSGCRHRSPDPDLRAGSGWLVDGNLGVVAIGIWLPNGLTRRNDQ